MKFRTQLLCAIMVLVAALPASAAVYGNFVGSLLTYQGVNEVTNSADPDGLFGAPILIGNDLIFTPTIFSSSSVGGTPDLTTATLNFTLVAAPGQTLNSVAINEVGDYTILGGSGATGAQINGLLTVTAFTDTGAVIRTAPLTIAPSGGVYSSGSGQFDASAEIDLSDISPLMAIVNFNNNLQTVSESTSSSFIQKKIAESDDPTIVISPTVVPLPAAVWLFGSLIGVLGAIRARRTYT